MSKLLFAALGAAAMLVVGSVAWATVPDGGGVIHACLKNGAVRIVDTDAGQSCKASEQPLDWNVAGQPGAPGGVSGYQLRTGDPVTLEPGASGEASVSCPEGTRALGGGYITGSDVQVTNVIPAGAGTVWSAAGTNRSPTLTGSIRARVVCADVTP